MIPPVKLQKGTHISTTALKSQFGTGPSTDCWVDSDDGSNNVQITYGHDDRTSVPRSSIAIIDHEIRTN